MTPTGIDVVELMMGNQEGILSAHQQESAPGLEPMFPLLNGPAGTMAEIKNLSGWPADGYTFDPDTVANPMIRQTFTELDDNAADYNNPKTYKIFVQPPIWMPRFYTPYSPPVAYQSPSAYLTYLNGIVQPVKDLGGPVETDFYGPYTDVNFGGNLGQVAYYLQRYRYNPDFNTMETNAYVPLQESGAFGRIRWQLFKMGANGLYSLIQTSLYNSQVQGPCPKLAWAG